VLPWSDAWIISGHFSVGDRRYHGTYLSLCDLKCPSCLQVGKLGASTDFYLSELFVGSIPIQDIDPSFIIVVLSCVGAGLATGWSPSKESYQISTNTWLPLFLDVTRCRFAAGYRRFGTAYRSHVRHVTSQKSERRNYASAEDYLLAPTNTTYSYKRGIWDPGPQQPVASHTHTHTHTHTRARATYKISSAYITTWNVPSTYELSWFS
jgi:hypothetical protein